MNITIHENHIKTIRSGDSKFIIKSGTVLAPRAGIEIHKDCPSSHIRLIKQCINNGWLMPVAYMIDEELAWEILKD